MSLLMKNKTTCSFFLTLSFLIVSQAYGEDISKFQTLYSKGTSSVMLSGIKAPSKIQMSNVGNNVCERKSFCLIWFFDDPKKAKAGVKKAKAGNWFDPIPGLIAVYAKNKRHNQIICYEPNGSC